MWDYPGQLGNGEPLVSVVIPVGGSRSSDIGRLCQCLEAILNQTYQTVEVLLVVDSDNDMIKNLDFPENVKLLEFNKPRGFTGRDTVMRLAFGWLHATGQILADTNVTILWPQDTIHKAVKLLGDGFEAVDGITRRLPDDQSFIGTFQDKALLTEFPAYKRNFVLCEDTFGKDKRLPTLTSFFMTRAFYDKVYCALQLTPEPGWEDFNLVRAMIGAGGQIYCTNDLVVYRNHKPKLRMGKQFTAGIGGAQFWVNHPENSYACLRCRMALASGVASTLFFLSTAMVAALSQDLLGVYLVICSGFLVTASIFNSIVAADWRGLAFPTLTAVQVGIWLSGFIYLLASENTDDDLVRWVEAHR